MSNLRLFALSVHERMILEVFLRDYPIPDLLKIIADSSTNAKLVVRLLNYFRSGGFQAFSGSVVDQDGDSSWHLSSTLESAQQWADDMTVVCFEEPRIYEIDIERFGFGEEHRIEYTPDASKSQL